MLYYSLGEKLCDPVFNRVAKEGILSKGCLIRRIILFAPNMGEKLVFKQL